MSLILNIETSSTNCSVALSKSGELIDFIEKDSPNFSHSEKLHQFIKDLIERNNASIDNLDAIAVGIGPGSYTGLRIGLSTAKGLCYGSDLPLIAISSLLNLAHNVEFDGLIIPTIDARRNEVYSVVLNSKYKIIKEESPQIINEESFLEFTKDYNILIIGNGQFKCKEIIDFNSKFSWNEKVLKPSAKNMVKFSYEKFEDNDFEDIAYLEPKYLKEFQANN